MKTIYLKTRHLQERQSGVALVAALVIMLVLTILGITVMNMTSLEEKMAFNTQDRYHARYLAESAALIIAHDNNLPSPEEAGVSKSVEFTLSQSGGTGGTIPGLKEGTAQIFFIQQTPSVNLSSNSNNMRFSSGSGTDDPFVFQIAASATTNAGTNARLKSGFYFDPPPSSNQN